MVTETSDTVQATATWRMNYSAPNLTSAAMFSRRVGEIEAAHLGRELGTFWEDILARATACISCRSRDWNHMQTRSSSIGTNISPDKRKIFCECCGQLSRKRAFLRNLTWRFSSEETLHWRREPNRFKAFKLSCGLGTP